MQVDFVERLCSQSEMAPLPLILGEWASHSPFAIFRSSKLWRYAYESPKETSQPAFDHICEDTSCINTSQHNDGSEMLIAVVCITKPGPGPTQEEDSMSIEEVVEAIAKLKSVKAPGILCGIDAEMLKAGGMVAAEWLHRVIELARATGKVAVD